MISVPADLVPRGVERRTHLVDELVRQLGAGHDRPAAEAGCLHVRLYPREPVLGDGSDRPAERVHSLLDWWVQAQEAEAELQRHWPPALDAFVKHGLDRAIAHPLQTGFLTRSGYVVQSPAPGDEVLERESQCS